MRSFTLKVELVMIWYRLYMDFFVSLNFMDLYGILSFLRFCEFLGSIIWSHLLRASYPNSSYDCMTFTISYISIGKSVHDRCRLLYLLAVEMLLLKALISLCSRGVVLWSIFGSAHSCKIPSALIRLLEEVIQGASRQ